MLKNYFIQVPMISGIPTLEPCTITTVSDSNDEDSDYVEMTQIMKLTFWIQKKF